MGRVARGVGVCVMVRDGQCVVAFEVAECTLAKLFEAVIAGRQVGWKVPAEWGGDGMATPYQDSKVVGVRPAARPGFFEVLLEHPSYDEVIEGRQTPSRPSWLFIDGVRSGGEAEPHP